MKCSAGEILQGVDLIHNETGARFVCSRLVAPLTPLIYMLMARWALISRLSRVVRHQHLTCETTDFLTMTSDTKCTSLTENGLQSNYLNQPKQA